MAVNLSDRTLERAYIPSYVEYPGTGLILVHNHLSGSINPSEADITITNKIVEAGNLFDIAVLDHLIIAAVYYSFADDGIICNPEDVKNKSIFIEIYVKNSYIWMN
jgi:hypothetical protein